MGYLQNKFFDMMPNITYILTDPNKFREKLNVVYTKDIKLWFTPSPMTPIINTLFNN